MRCGDRIRTPIRPHALVILRHHLGSGAVNRSRGVRQRFPQRDDFRNYDHVFHAQCRQALVGRRVRRHRRHQDTNALLRQRNRTRADPWNRYIRKETFAFPAQHFSQLTFIERSHCHRFIPHRRGRCRHHHRMQRHMPCFRQRSPRFLQVIGGMRQPNPLRRSAGFFPHAQ